jgi:hypothetical protein
MQTKGLLVVTAAGYGKFLGIYFECLAITPYQFISIKCSCFYPHILYFYIVSEHSFRLSEGGSRSRSRWVHACNFVTDTICSYDLNFHPVPHGITVSCERYTMGFPVCYGSQKRHECKEGEGSGRWWRVTMHVQTCSGRNRIIHLMWRPNTDSTPNKAVTLPRN